MYKERVSGVGYNTKRNVFDEEDIKEVERLASSLTVAQLADYFKIGLTTLYEAFKRQPLVAESYKKGKAKAVERIANVLQEHAINGGPGNMTAAIFYLKTQARWSEAVPETKIEDQIVLTPEQQEEKDKDIKLFTQWKKEKGIE